MRNNKLAFSLIELMIVIAIIGILASIAIPAYQNYLIRARVTDMLTALDPIKQGLAEYRYMKGTFPAPGGGTPELGLLQSEGYAMGDLTQVSKVIGSYAVHTRAASPTVNANITVTSNTTIGIPAGGTVTITLAASYNDAGIKWDCYTDSAANLIYVPDACRKLWSAATPTY